MYIFTVLIPSIKIQPRLGMEDVLSLFLNREHWDMLPNVFTMSSSMNPPLNFHYIPESSNPPQCSRVSASTLQLVAQSTVTNPIQDSAECADSSRFLLPLNLKTCFKSNFGETETRSKILQAAGAEWVRYLSGRGQIRYYLASALQQSIQGWCTRGSMLKYYATLVQTSGNTGGYLTTLGDN